MERLAALTFPQCENVALGNARGKAFRYEVNKIGRAKWRLIVDENGRMTDRLEFSTKRAARLAARAHFQRRQCEYN